MTDYPNTMNAINENTSPYNGKTENVVPNPFYSMSSAVKRAEFSRLPGALVDIKALLDDIADGCGGCERMMYTTAEGFNGWISVFDDQGSIIVYAYITEVEDVGLIIRAQLASVHRDFCQGMSQDDVRVYARLIHTITNTEPGDAFGPDEPNDEDEDDDAFNIQDVPYLPYGGEG